MLIGVDTAVYCGGNFCGSCRYLIVHPQSFLLTHLVITANNIERLVSVSFLSCLSDLQIQLKCTLNELSEQPPFRQTHFEEIIMPDYGTSEKNYLTSQPDRHTWIYEPVVDYNIPAGSLIISRQTQIAARNGHMGQFKAFSCEPETYQITDLVFQRGHLWERKRETVPAAAIDRLEGDTIYLNILKSAF